MAGPGAVMRDIFMAGFADEIEKLGQGGLLSWMTEPISSTVMRAMSGHGGTGGIVTPGGSTSTRGLPSAKARDIVVSDAGTIMYAPTPIPGARGAIRPKVP